MLPPVNVNRDRGVAASRRTATSVRLDRAKTNRFLPGNVGDALATVPGVSLVKTGAWSSFVSIRGLSGNRVLMTVDDVRLNTSRGHGAQASLVALDRVEALEVMPGASGARFGSGALGGVLNIVTHRSLFEDTPHSSVTIAARGETPGGSYLQSGRVRMAGRNAGFELAGSVAGLDYLNTPAGPIPNSSNREDDYALRGATRWRSASVDLETTHHAAHDVGIPGLTGGGVTSASYPLDARDAQRLELAVESHSWLPDVRVLGSHQNLATEFQESAVDSVFFRGRFVATRGRDAHDRADDRIATVAPTLLFSRVSGLRLFGEYTRETAGGPLTTVETVKNSSGATTSQTTTTGETMPPAQRENWALGASMAPDFWTVHLESALRYDSYWTQADSSNAVPASMLDVTDSRWTGEVGVARPIGPAEPYAHVAGGFRVPTLDELFYNDFVHGGLRLFGNPDLVSERGTTYEAGVRAVADQLSWLHSARISVYRSDVHDLISFHYIGMLYLIPRFQYYNVGHARLEGIEGTAQLRFGGVGVDLNASVPRGYDLSTGHRLEDIGASTASVDFMFPAARLLPNGTLGTRFRWSGPVTDVSAPLERKAFTTTALEVSGTYSNLRGVMAVNNLWNQSYVEPMSFVPEPGRSLALSVRYVFSGHWPF